MSAEWLTAAATAGTFVVIAASAIAAMFQIRYLRSSNQIATLTDMRQTMDSPQFQAALAFVMEELPERLKDTELRRIFITRAAQGQRPLPAGFESVRSVANFFTNIGILVRTGIVDRATVCYLWHDAVLRAWRCIAPVKANFRALAGEDPWQNFEYLAVLCQDWVNRHPHGLYPQGVPRMPSPDLWPETKERIHGDVT